MSEFYATIQGNRNAKTCGGSKASGIDASAQSCDGSVRVTLYKHNDVTYCKIAAENGSTAFASGHVIYDGTLEKLFTYRAIKAVHESA